MFGGLRQIDHPQYKALILRRTFPELRELIDRSLLVFPQLGGVWNVQDHRYRFPSGATYQFGYCSTYAEAQQFQGQQYTWIGFDEIGQLAEERIWLFLMSRNRAAAAGLVRMMRASANPGGPGHGWIKRRFVSRCPHNGVPVDVELDNDALGQTTSRAFVKATLRDNPTLMAHDPGYEQRLKLLPELEYRWLALGDWDAGAGLALAELARDKHLIGGVDVQRHWTLFGAFDWGYQHPFAFGVFACNDGGTVFLLDSVSGRHLEPPDIALRVLDRLDAIGVGPNRLRYTCAGHDCWADHKARGERVPTIAEHFQSLGLPLVRANISRIAGVQNVRRYLSWRVRDTLDGVEREIPPRFQLCETYTNKRVFECLETRVSDPDDPEDVLKTDADERGEGGDDGYDMVRYGLASRPLVATLPRLGPTSKVSDRAPSFDFQRARFQRITPQDELQKMFAETGRPANAAPVSHRTPNWSRPPATRKRS